MITHIKIQNFRSFLEAEVDLQPFSLVVGANGSGKTNLLLFLLRVGDPLMAYSRFDFANNWQKHLSRLCEEGFFSLKRSDLETLSGEIPKSVLEVNFDPNFPFGNMPDLRRMPSLYNLDANAISAAEDSSVEPLVKCNGAGAAQVLESLKNGRRKDLFEAVERAFKSYVPEVEKLSLRTAAGNKMQIEVHEKGLPVPIPATELSEGTRIILAILTIIHQEKPPSMILLEDIDRGLHPRLFEYLAPLLRDIAVKHDINIVATTHNPYLVDAMQDHKDAVIIVEKKDGASTLSTLASRLEGLDYDKIDPDDMPLGQLWFSGLVGGVPKSLSSRTAK